jgi:hypothetical protein
VGGFVLPFPLVSLGARLIFSCLCCQLPFHASESSCIELKACTHADWKEERGQYEPCEPYSTEWVRRNQEALDPADAVLGVHGGYLRLI